MRNNRQIAQHNVRRGALAAAAAVGGRILRNTVNYVRNGSGGGRNAGTRDELPVSQYRDYKKLYTAKKVGKKGKKKTKFASKVRKIVELDQPTQAVVLKNQFQISSSSGNQAMVMIPGLYTVSGSNTGEGDMYGLLTNLQGTLTTSLGSSNSLDNCKVYVESAHMDAYITNGNNAPVFIDLYEVICRSNDVDFSALSQYFVSPDALPTKASISSVTFGVTPFQLNTVTSNWKIMNKTRHIIQSGEAISISMHDKKYRTIHGEWWGGTGSATNVVAKKGWTKCWILTTFSIPSTSGTQPPSQNNYVEIVTSKIYHCKVGDSYPKSTTALTF